MSSANTSMMTERVPAAISMPPRPVIATLLYVADPGAAPVLT
jgi:hypothetical protein